MIRRAALNVSLTPELVAFIAAQVASGRYATASKVVRIALRSFEREVTRQPGQAQTEAVGSQS